MRKCFADPWPAEECLALASRVPFSCSIEASPEGSFTFIFGDVASLKEGPGIEISHMIFIPTNVQLINHGDGWRGAVIT